MKKLLAILLAAIMLLSVVACNNNQDVNNPDEPDNGEQTPDTPDEGGQTPDEGEQTPDAPADLAYNDAEELLTMIWNAFADEEKFFIGGGDMEHMVMDAPGKFHMDIEEAAAVLRSMTHYPEANFDKLTDVATMMHGQLANNFTCAAFRFENAEDAAAMVDVLNNIYPSVQWECGFPEKYTIITVPGNYVIAAFGLGEYCIDPLITHTQETIDGAVVVVDQILA